jgi:D-alanyl-D-alanine carboxypeptidase (penicillin-binding protein 5/6)
MHRRSAAKMQQLATQPRLRDTSSWLSLLMPRLVMPSIRSVFTIALTALIAVLAFAALAVCSAVPASAAPVDDGHMLIAPAPGSATTEDEVVWSIPPHYPRGEPKPPWISSRAAILIHADTGTILFSHAANNRLPMASTTKIMTAIVALETLKLDQKVTISSYAASINGSVFGLMAGEKMTVEELLYALMVLSGNDAAIALAEASAGSASAFVAKMNEKAEELGLTNTRFRNTNGLNVDGHYSSAKDMATLTAYAMRDPVFCRVVGTCEYETVRPDYTGEPELKTIKNHNILLKELPWVTGVKTGSTPYAKYCLVFSARLDGLPLIGVLLGAADDDTRWKETKAILDYGYKVCPRTVLVERGSTVLTLDTADPLGRKIRLVSEGALATRITKGESITAKAHIDRAATLPVEAGEVFGTVEFFDGTESVGHTRLLAAEPLQKATLGMIMAEWQRKWALRLL